MTLFLLSFLLIFTSSYFISTCFEKENFYRCFIYTLLIAFAQVVLTTEVLSLFSSINTTWTLIINTLFFVISLFIWNKKSRPICKPNIKKFFKDIFKALNRDKMLYIFSLGLIFFIVISLFLALITPTISADALSYHYNRALFWIANGNLNHFDIADNRNLVMPINSEIIYSWIYMLTKKDVFIGIPSFIGYIMSIASLYSILGIFGFCTRKKLWAVFMLSSIAGITIQSSGSETDIIVGGLVLSAITLFLSGIKENKLSPVYFSSLAISLALGTKTPTFFMLPSCAILFSYFLVKYNKKAFVKYTLYFIGFSIINFLLFSAYNYILNFIDYGHFGGSITSINKHSATHTIKGFTAIFIRHLFLLIDFSGFNYNYTIQGYIFAFINKLLELLKIPNETGVIMSDYNTLNNTLIDPMVGCGVIGVFVFVPCLLIALTKFKSNKYRILTLFSICCFVNIAVMSLIIGYMLYSTRFIISFVIMCSPIFVLLYIKSNKNILKYLILFYTISYLVIISSNIPARHFLHITNAIIKGKTITDIRYTQKCTTLVKFEGTHPECTLKKEILNFPQNSKIGLFPSIAYNTAKIKEIEAIYDYKINSLLVEKIHKYNLQDYDYLIFVRGRIDSDNIQNFEEGVNNYFFNGKSITYKNNKLPQCLYLTDKNVLITNNNIKTTVPYKVECFLPTNILTANNFIQIGEIKLKNTYEYDEENMVYRIYENKNSKKN